MLEMSEFENPTVFTEPLAAWKYLCMLGGIEPEYRDQELIKNIHSQLAPSMPTLEAALEGATMEAFLSAFFKASQPYIRMFKDILEFFTQAAATQGQHQWMLQVADIDMDLDHFRQNIETWTHLGHATIMIPVLTWDGVWNLFEHLRTYNLVAKQVALAAEKKELDLPEDVRSWVESYHEGQYNFLPVSLCEPDCPAELRKPARIAQTALASLINLGLSRSQLMELYRNHSQTLISGEDRLYDATDALEFWSIAQNETDYWLRSFVVALSASATLLAPDELVSVGSWLDNFIDQFPVRPAQVDLTINDLQSLLSLPIWQRRYELYSVWIATETVRALKEHDVEIHHENGKIAFAFKKTNVATVHSSPGPFVIFSERREPIVDPEGEGRKENVQPDHTIWTTNDGIEECRMVIEVKHYKRSAKQAFLNVFHDYAKAFPKAQIYLISHGPTGKAVDSVSSSVKNRCYAIPYLTADNQLGRLKFADAVRACLGAPIRWDNQPKELNPNILLVIDVSGSMKLLLNSVAMQEYIEKLVSLEQPAQLIAVDNKIVGKWPATRAGLVNLLHSGGGSTALRGAVQALLQNVARLVVITDKEGHNTLPNKKTYLHPFSPPTPGLIVACIGATSAVAS